MGRALAVRPIRRCWSPTTVVYAVQVNGKLRGQMEVALDAEKDAVLAAARAVPNVAAHLDGAQVVKEIVVPGRLVNLVVREG